MLIDRRYMHLLGLLLNEIVVWRHGYLAMLVSFTTGVPKSGAKQQNENERVTSINLFELSFSQSAYISDKLSFLILLARSRNIYVLLFEEKYFTYSYRIYNITQKNAGKTCILHKISTFLFNFQSTQYLLMSSYFSEVMVIIGWQTSISLFYCFLFNYVYIRIMNIFFSKDIIWTHISTRNNTNLRLYVFSSSQVTY